jgi:hypothetical protein
LLFSIMDDSERNAGASTATDTLKAEPAPGATSSNLHTLSSRVSGTKTGLGNTGEEIELQQLPMTPNEKDSDNAANSAPTDPFVTHKWRAYMQFASVCFSLFMAGWNDGTTGPLLPRIQEFYHVSLTKWAEGFHKLTNRRAGRIHHRLADLRLRLHREDHTDILGYV